MRESQAEGSNCVECSFPPGSGTRAESLRFQRARALTSLITAPSRCRTIRAQKCGMPKITLPSIATSGIPTPLWVQDRDAVWLTNFDQALLQPTRPDVAEGNDIIWRERDGVGHLILLTNPTPNSGAKLVKRVYRVKPQAQATRRQFLGGSRWEAYRAPPSDRRAGTDSFTAGVPVRGQTGRRRLLHQEE